MFEELLREVAAAPSPVPVPFEMLEQQRYRMLEYLGGGGSGQVYKAYDEQLRRHVALKFLNTVGADHTTQLVKEARTQARVRHAGVYQVYEVVESLGRPFIALQLIDGPTLAVAKLELGDKIAIMRQVAEAVEAAHQLGIVHRDVKPSNIMIERVNEGWQAFVMDFGLAREVGKSLTNAIVGTPQFMAPEQVRGEADRIGPRTDVWALGATLYTLLAGAPPFDGGSVAAILRQVEHEPPARLRSVSPELEAIALRCLEKLPERRYPDAAALARDLAAFERGDPVSARPPSTTRILFARLRRRVPLVAVGLGLVAVALVVALRPAQKWHPIVREIEPIYDEDASGVSVSPDGKTLLYAASRTGGWTLYLQSVEGGPAQPLANSENARAPSWSSDGKQIYFVRRDTSDGKERIERMPRDQSSPAVVVTAGSEVCECAGNLFYLQNGGDGVWHLLLREPGKDPRELGRSSKGFTSLSCSRDGGRAAYWTGGVAERVGWVDIGEGIEHLLPALGEESLGPVFSPDARSLILTVRRGLSYRLWEQSLDGQRSRPLSENNHETRPRFGPDGRLFFNVDNSGLLISARPINGAPARRLADNGGWLSAIEPTPDGREVVTSRILYDSTPQVVALSVSDGSERVLARGYYPTVSFDGTRVYFLDNKNDDIVWEVPTAGGAIRQVAHVPLEVFALHAGKDALHLTLPGEILRAWRQPYDGSKGNDEGSTGLQIVEPGAGGWRLGVTGDGYGVVVPPGPWPAVSPEKTRFKLAQVTRDRSGFSAVDGLGDAWLITPGKGERRLLHVGDNVVMLALSPDGNTLYTIDRVRHVHRAELTNYAALPKL